MKPASAIVPTSVFVESRAQHPVEFFLVDALAVQRPGRAAHALAPSRGPAASGLFEATSTTS